MLFTHQLHLTPPCTLPLELVEPERSHVDPGRTDRLPAVRPERGPKHRLGYPRRTPCPST